MGFREGDERDQIELDLAGQVLSSLGAVKLGTNNGHQLHIMKEKIKGQDQCNCLQVFLVTCSLVACGVN